MGRRGAPDQPDARDNLPRPGVLDRRQLLDRQVRPPVTGDATLVETRGLTFGFAREEPVLVDVDLVVGREVVALTGASGTGKTTPQ